MSKDAGLVKRLIAFLKKPDALDYQERKKAHNPYDDYEPQDYGYADAYGGGGAVSDYSTADVDDALLSDNRGGYNHASRLDALVMRAVQQFNANIGFVLRYEHNGRMRYCTGRDLDGRFVPHTAVNPDRRAVFLTLDSGESQFFVHTDGDMPVSVLCGPLWVGDEVVGVLYLHSPARSQLHRGVFDVFCNQVARLMHAEGVA